MYYIYQIVIDANCRENMAQLLHTSMTVAIRSYAFDIHFQHLLNFLVLYRRENIFYKIRYFSQLIHVNCIMCCLGNYCHDISHS